MNFATRLGELRRARKISQTQLAKELGITSSAISMYECGKREPSFETEELIADYFNVDLDYLRGISNTTNKIVSGDAHLLLHIYKEIDEHAQTLLLGYARGLLDMHINAERKDLRMKVETIDDDDEEQEAPEDENENSKTKN